MFERLSLTTRHHVETTKDIRTFGSFILSGSLRPGMLFIFANGEPLFIGDGTPYEGPSTVSHDGWPSEEWNDRIVVRVIESDDYFDMTYDIMDHTGTSHELCEEYETRCRERLGLKKLGEEDGTN